MRVSPALLLSFALLLSVHSPSEASTAVQPWIGWDLACDTQVLRLADPEHEWRLVEGFDVADGGGRSMAEEAGVLLLLGAPVEGTTIYVEARTDGRRVALAARLNGHELGERALRKRLDTLAFAVPHGSARRGVNVLRLEIDRAAARRTRLTIHRIGIGPLRCRGKEPKHVEVAAEEPLVLPRDAVVLVPVRPNADYAEVFFAKAPGVAVEVGCWTATEAVALARLESGVGGRGRSFVPVGEKCPEALGLTLLGEGPGAAREVRIGVTSDPGLAWRGTVRLQMALLVLATLAVVGIFAIRLGVRQGSVAARSDVPWLDVGWIVFLALLPRLVFWALYPAPGQAGDSYEYLLRAGFLVEGVADFWGDLEWHTWGNFIRPPGYYALLALFDAPSASGRLAVIGLQLGLSALTAGLTYLLTLPLFGRPAAWIAGLFFAGYLGSILTFSRILAEPLFMVLLLAGLASVAWLAERPRWGLALAAGIFFGLAALVRPGPIYYPPLAGLLLVPTLGWRRGLHLTAALVAGLMAIVVPWSVRNSISAGRLVGVETVSVANLLLNHPDERVLSIEGVDLEQRADRDRYRAGVHRLEPGPLTYRAGPHVRRVLVQALRHPVDHLRRVGVNARDLLGPAPDNWLAWILGERDAVRIARLTSLLNWQYGGIQALGIIGFALFLRRPHTWPVTAWLLVNLLPLVFFFHALLRYREPSTPILMAFAAGALLAGAGQLSGVGKWSRSEQNQ